MGKSIKENNRSIPAGKTQVNFNITNEMLEKVKSLAFLENVTQSEIYNMSLKRFIDSYEKKNGEIKPKPQGNGLENL